MPVARRLARVVRLRVADRAATAAELDEAPRIVSRLAHDPATPVAARILEERPASGGPVVAVRSKRGHASYASTVGFCDQETASPVRLQPRSHEGDRAAVPRPPRPQIAGSVHVAGRALRTREKPPLALVTGHEPDRSARGRADLEPRVD